MNAGRSAWWILTVGLSFGIIWISGFPELHASSTDTLSSNFCGSGELLDEEMPISLYEPTEEPELRYQTPNNSKFELPPVNWSVNSHGLRDDPIPEEKPEGTIRVLVVGDSNTEGWGLNTSQRFTEKAEKSLNSTFEPNINVINAGIGGPGMKGYYLYLYNEGLKLDPDIVVVPFVPSDEISLEEYRKMNSRLREKYGLGRKNLAEDEEAWEERQEWFNDMALNQTWKSSDIITYGNMMRHLSEQNNADFFLYPMKADMNTHLKQPVKINNTSYSSRIEAWKQECGMRIVEAPEQIKGISYEGEKYTFYKNFHFNERANSLLAERLVDRLETYLKEERGWAEINNGSTGS